MNLFYLHKNPKVSATLHCDKHVVKMIIEYAQMLSTAHRMLDGDPYVSQTLGGRRIQRWRLDPDREDILYKASHINHPSTKWVRENSQQYMYAYHMFVSLCNEYTYRYGKTHLTDSKLREILFYTPDNITLGKWKEPPQCMPDDVKVENDSLSAYHKYYAVYKKDFAKWTKREVPQFMSM